MVLYCIQHPGNIAKALVHKFKYHGEEEAVFFTDEDPASKYCPPIEEIQYYKMPNSGKIIAFSEVKEEIIQNVQNIYDKFLNEISIRLSDFNEIYCIYDLYNPLILYCRINGIKYICIECIDNHFYFFSQQGSFLRRRLKIDKVKSPDTYMQKYSYNELVRDMHLQDGQGANCKKGYLFSEASAVPDGDVPTEVFGYYNSLSNLDQTYKGKLVKAYELDKHTFDAIVLLNSPPWTEDRLRIWHKTNIPSKYTEKDRYGNVCYFYKVVLDYYFGEISFALKLHPLSGEKFIESFSEFKQIPNAIPAEFFSLPGKHFDVLCPAKSSSLGIFEELGFNVTYFDEEIFDFIRIIHFVHTAFSLIKSREQSVSQISFYGIDQKELQYFCDWAFKDFKAVEFVPLNAENALSAEYVIADKPDDTFAKIISNGGGRGQKLYDYSKWKI